MHGIQLVYRDRVSNVKVEPSRSPMTPTTTEMSSFLPPTKSMPSSMARIMNGVVAVVCSETARARSHNASETSWGEKGGRELGWLGGENSERVSRMSSSNWGCQQSPGRALRMTYKIVHKAVTANDDNILLLDTDVVALGVLHRLVARVGSELKGEVESVLHFRCPEDNLASANNEQAAVAKIGDQEGRMVEQRKDACRGTVDSLMSARHYDQRLTSCAAHERHFSYPFCMISTGSRGRRCLRSRSSDPRFQARAAQPDTSSPVVM